MKSTIHYSILLALASSGIAFGAGATATTPPVGYITSSIAGSIEGIASESYISATLVQPTVYAGVSNATPSGGKTITFAATNVPDNFDGTYVLEITAGTSEGWWSTVVSSTSSSIIVLDDFPGGLPAAVSVSVRKHNTLLSYLGTNAPGIITFDGVKTVFDEVQVLNLVEQVGPPVVPAGAAVGFVYVSGADWGDPENYPNGVWMRQSTSEVANNYVIEPGYAVLVKRRDAAPLTFVSSGTVKTTKTQVDIYPSWNWIGTQIANGSTLNGMQFNSQLVQFDGISPTYDDLQIVRANQKADSYAAIDLGGGATTMWPLAGESDAGAEPVPEGTGMLINRRGTSGPSTITIPGTVVAP